MYYQSKQIVEDNIDENLVDLLVEWKDEGRSEEQIYGAQNFLRGKNKKIKDFINNIRLKDIGYIKEMVEEAKERKNIDPYILGYSVPISQLLDNIKTIEKSLKG